MNLNTGRENKQGANETHHQSKRAGQQTKTGRGPKPARRKEKLQNKTGSD